MFTSVVDATFRDLSYIAAHMRAADRAEVEAQLDEWSAPAIAAMSLRDFAFCVELNGNPEAAFGCGQVRKGYWIAWSWGTDRLTKCLPVMVRFITEQLQPAVYEAGALRVEARALARHRQARHFLERIGGQFRCYLPAYGKGGEDFVLYDWTRETYVPVQHSINADASAGAAHAAA
ncbi:GNAT family N-acetyltransferase [Bradyrhizobium japonicum]|uniref:GNAT family N-acetyltransferase n=1 Tax=Bradyrhizobium japonicum TaxID=375 RepID=UPI000416A266|nr:GNAT family protein [Bradyrhizobium japonicum]